jgi:sulfoxide reductase heme-binding subunit YedZ
MTRRTGRIALVFLMLSLVPTVFARATGYRQALRIRRALGLYSFMYAAVHFLTYVGLDYRFNLRLVLEAIRVGRLVWVGLGAFVIMVPLAVTSTRGWIRRLGKNWKRLHRSAYVAAALAVLHYSWRFKELRTAPLLVGAALLILLVARLPLAVRILPGRREQT